ncbi:hypothetical protein [Microvirgula curvata]
MPPVIDRYDWRALRRRIRHLPIAPDKRSEGRAILVEMRRILKEVSKSQKGT